MEKHQYICQYCGKEYTPKRRRIQKFCCRSCKNNEYNFKKKNNLFVKSEIEKSENKPNQIEKISWAGIGNAAIGILIFNVLKNFFMRPENKPATRRDLEDVYRKHNARYHPITNGTTRFDGAKQFYDLQTQKIVYITKKLS
jgi:hypothetical protein